MDTMLCDGQMVMYKLEAAEAMASNSTVRGGALDSRRRSQRGKTEISSLEVFNRSFIVKRRFCMVFC